MKLGELLKELRLQRKLTAQTVADRAGLHVSTVSCYESGRRVITTREQIVALAGALEVPESVLWDAIPAGQGSARWIRL